MSGIWPVLIVAAACALVAAWARWWPRRKPSRLERLRALGLVDEALKRAEQDERDENDPAQGDVNR